MSQIKITGALNWAASSAATIGQWLTPATTCQRNCVGTKVFHVKSEKDTDDNMHIQIGQDAVFQQSVVSCL